MKSGGLECPLDSERKRRMWKRKCRGEENGGRECSMESESGGLECPLDTWKGVEEQIEERRMVG